MDLYLIRHAKAAVRSADMEDALRPLTADGRRSFAVAVEGMAGLGWTFDRMYHSPLLRAVETAELLFPLLHGESVSTAQLADDPSSALLREVTGRRVALVGHEPWMSELAAWLIHGDRSAGDGYDLKKGGVVWLEGTLAPGQMLLRGFFPPKVLRAIGRRGHNGDETD